MTPVRGSETARSSEPWPDAAGKGHNMHKELPARKISSEIMSVWRRHGAGEAWQTALLWSCGDRAKAARLVSDLDAHAHVRDGILSYGGLSLQDVTEVEPPA